MKTLILACACACAALLSLPAAAQQPSGAPTFEQLTKALDLTAEQQKELRPVFAEAQAKAAREAKERESKSTGPKDAESHLLTRQADLRSRLAAVLTTEQMAEYERLTAAQAAHPRTTNPHPAHGHHDMATQPSVRDGAETPAR
jgi:hypothetical protein